MIKKFLKLATVPAIAAGMLFGVGSASASSGTHTCGPFASFNVEYACWTPSPLYSDLSDYENIAGSGGLYKLRLRNLNTNTYYGPWTGSGTGNLFGGLGVNLGQASWQFLVTPVSVTRGPYYASKTEA